MESPRKPHMPDRVRAHFEVRSLSKAPNPQVLPGRRSIGCPLLRVCVHCVYVHYCVCVHLDGLNAEHKFRVWVSIPGHTSLQN